MLAHLTSCEFRVACSQSFENGPMHLGDHPQVSACFQSADKRSCLDSQRALDLKEYLIARGLDNDLVKDHIVEQLLVKVVGLCRLTHLIELDLKLIEN